MPQRKVGKRVRGILDPYCYLTGPARPVTSGDKNADLAALARYARSLNVAVWRFKDGKIALTAPHYKLGDKGGLVFGQRGTNTGHTAMQAFQALHAQSQQLQTQLRIMAEMERVVAEKAFRRFDPHGGALGEAQKATRDVVQMVDENTGGVIGNVTRQAQVAFADSAEVASKQYSNWFPAFDALFDALPGAILVESRVARLGEGGRAFTILMRRRNQTLNRILGRSFRRLNTQLAKLNKEEVEHGLRDYVEEGIVRDEARRPVLESVKVSLKEVNDEFYETLKALGADVKPRVEAGPFNPTGEYWPHRRDLSQMKDLRMSKKVIDDEIERWRRVGVTLSRPEALQLVERQGLGTDLDLMVRRVQERHQLYKQDGSVMSRSEAVEILDRHMQLDGERIAGNIERPRLNVAGYIHDARRAYVATWTRNAYRVADLAHFGFKDRNVHKIIDNIQRELSMGSKSENTANKALKYVQDVYHLEIGRKRAEFGSDFLNAIYNWQAIKLSLAALANATQSMNTVMMVGFRPFLKAAVSAGRLSPIAHESGALPARMYGSPTTLRIINETLDDVQSQGMSALLKPDAGTFSSIAGAASAGLREIALLPFSLVETMNRGLAVRAGEHYFRQITRVLHEKPFLLPELRQNLARRRLLELDLNPEVVLRAVKAGDRAALDEMAMMAGQRVSNVTQFRSDFQNMPLWANESEPGRFIFQFKTFAFNQVRFMMRMLNPRSGLPFQDTLRAWAMLGTVFPTVGVAVTATRASLMGPTLTSEFLDERLRDPTIWNLALAGMSGIVMIGGLGILADMGWTAAIGNRFALDQFAVPPGLSSMLNGAAVLGLAGKAILTDDPDAWTQARGGLLREAGGLGGTAEQGLQRWSGEAEEAPGIGETFGAAWDTIQDISGDLGM